MKLIQKIDITSDYKKLDHLIVTTNAFIKRNGELVMGAGLAKRVRDERSDIGRLYGHAIQSHNMVYGQNVPYGVILNICEKLGAFQVKHHFKDQASLELITNSTASLKTMAEQSPDSIFGLNYPGIGNGRLKPEAVQRIIETLPDNVHVYKL